MDRTCRKIEENRGQTTINAGFVIRVLLQIIRLPQFRSSIFDNNLEFNPVYPFKTAKNH